MAQRYYQQFQKTLVKEVVSVFAKISIGASGAPTLLNYASCQGINSIVRNSAGNYTLVLGQPTPLPGHVDQYAFLLSVDQSVLFNGISAVPHFNVVSESVASAGSITFQYSSASGTAMDPDSGSVLLLEIKLKNSHVV